MLLAVFDHHWKSAILLQEHTQIARTRRNALDVSLRFIDGRDRAVCFPPQD